MVVAVQIAEMTTYGKILKQVIEDKGFKVAQFAREAGIVRSRLNAAFNWVKIDEVQRDLLDMIAPKVGFADADLLDRAIRSYANMPPSLADHLKELAEKTREIQRTPPSPAWLGKEPPPPNTRVRPIPGGNEIAGGDPSTAIDSPEFAADDEQQFKPGELWEFDESAFWIKVHGHSMWPDFAEGDVVIGSPALRDQVEGGDPVCIRFTHESRWRGGRTLKFIHWIDETTVELRSCNPAVKPFRVNMGEIQWLGPVVVHIRYPGKDGSWDLSAIPKAPRVRSSPAHPLGEGPQQFPDHENPNERHPE